MRTIDRLRYEFGVPIEYDESNRGYYLTNPGFSFAALPPGRDEIIALMLMSELATAIDDRSLHDSISTLWTRVTNGRADVDRDLEYVGRRFSTEVTTAAKLLDMSLMRLLALCHGGQLVVVTYQSPWRRGYGLQLYGTFEHVHYREGMVYVLFKDSLGRRTILNVSFIQGIEEIAQLPAHTEHFSPDSHEHPHGAEGVGAWAGVKPESIEITIASPASHYYAAQTWHAEQTDSWDGDSLIRRFPGVVSAELARRVLSLGRFVTSVRPVAILERIREDATHLVRLCETKGSR